MKKATIASILAIFAFSVPAYAATITKTVNTSATVATVFTMDVKLFKNDIDGADVTAGNAMPFGTLADIGTGTLRSNNNVPANTGAYLAYITVNSQSKPWTLTQTGTNMTSGANTLESGSLVVGPVYVPSDNGGVTDGTLGTKGTWVATNKSLYTSTAAGPIRTIRAYYSITDDPAAGATAPNIPLNKPAGTYTGTVTFTATA
jgi:hypothetical protein